jgi:hypothetical protein
MLYVFGLEYKKIEDSLTNWKGKKNVEGDGHKRHNAFLNAQVVFKFWYFRHQYVVRFVI